MDASFFQPSGQAYEPDLVSFVGRMDYFPNQQAVTTFCADVLPELQRRLPGTRFEIVGADPSPEIRELGKLPGVTVTGSVPDVRPYVTRAALTVAPLEIARGTQNKILESMAMGVPVVCSRQAVGGVDAIPGEHLLAYDTREQFIEAILTVLQSPDRRAAAGDRRPGTGAVAPQLAGLDATRGCADCLTVREAGGSLELRCPAGSRKQHENQYLRTRLRRCRLDGLPRPRRP